MTLDELESFLRIASGGGFSQASRALHRSQPAISRRIRSLEQSLGAPLFERRPRNLQLTAAGRALLPYAEAALSALHDARAAVRVASGQRDAVPSLRLVIVGTLADVHIVQALQHFRTEFGRNSIAMRTATSREVSALVRRGEADVGVRYFSDPDPKLESIALGAERLFVVLPAQHPVRAQRARDLRAFAEETWLAFPPDPRRPEVPAQFRAQLLGAGLADPVISYVDSLTAQKRLVEAGFGIALLSQSNAAEELGSGAIATIRVGNLTASHDVVAVVRRGGFLSAASQRLLEIIRREFSSKRVAR